MFNVKITESIDFDGILNKSINRAYRNALDLALTEYTDWLQRNSPRGVSPTSESLAGGWDIEFSQKARNQLFAEGAIVNRSEASYFRIVGRAPGRFPPFHQGSALERWAAATGIPAYLVARKIARLGTERWRSGNNILGLDPRTGAIDPNNEGIRIFERTLEQEMAKIQF
jgi:hypothetical protein